MDDELTQTYVEFPDYVFITQWIEVIGPAIVLVACLLLVRRAAAPALLGAIGALATGVSSGLWLAEYDDRLPAGLGNDDLFWELTSYGRSIGLAVMGLALVLALLRPRRVGRSAADSAFTE